MLWQSKMRIVLEVKHSRMSSAPVSLVSLPLSSDGSEMSTGDEVQLINAIYELRDTELSFFKDLKFILEEVLPQIAQQQCDRELLFGGLREIMQFSYSLYRQFVTIADIEDRFVQCQKLATLFLEEMVELRGVYAPYCARQSEASVKAAQVSFQKDQSCQGCQGGTYLVEPTCSGLDHFKGAKRRANKSV